MPSIAASLAPVALSMLSAQGQPVTLQRVTGSVANADGSVDPIVTNYPAVGLFESVGRSRMTVAFRQEREAAALRDVVWLAASGLAITPQVGDVLYRASTAIGTPRRVEAVDSVQPGTVAVLHRVEVAR